LFSFNLHIAINEDIDSQARAVSAALHIPQIGGHAVTGARFSVPAPLSLLNKDLIPNENTKH